MHDAFDESLIAGEFYFGFLHGVVIGYRLSVIGAEHDPRLSRKHAEISE
jgi:hypothetical protein